MHNWWVLTVKIIPAHILKERVRQFILLMPLVLHYIFMSRDSSNINKFTKPDFSNNPSWPIYETSDIMVPSILDKALFGSITVFGKKQLTYKGWPLYYFGQDNYVRGATKGVSVPTPGIWPVAVKGLTPAPSKHDMLLLLSAGFQPALLLYKSGR